VLSCYNSTAGDWKASNQSLTQIRKSPSKEGILTAKFAKKSQRSQRANYLFIKMLPILCSRCVILNH